MRETENERDRQTEMEMGIERDGEREKASGFGQPIGFCTVVDFSLGSIGYNSQSHLSGGWGHGN